MHFGHIIYETIIAPGIESAREYRASNFQRVNIGLESFSSFRASIFQRVNIGLQTFIS